jgi:hypothetical protein
MGFLSQITSVENLGKAFMNMQMAVGILNAVRHAMIAVGQSIQTSRDYIKGMLSEMETARKESRELAALRGMKPTAGFTAMQAMEAGAAGLDVGEYTEFQTGFQAYAGQYIGAEGASAEELKKAHQKISGAQARRLEKKVATYAMGARGLKAEDSSRLLGVILAKAEAGAGDEDIMSPYAKLMKVMELAPGKTSPMISQLAELAMESVGEGGDFRDILESGYILRTMAQRNPMEAATYGRGLLRGLREIRASPQKSRELGITKGMDVFAQLEAIDQALVSAQGRGEEESIFLGKYFTDIREWGGARVAVAEGLREGGFARAAAEAESVGAGTAEAESRAYLGGQTGRAATDRMKVLEAQRLRAGHYVELKHLQQEALQSLVSTGQLEVPEDVMHAILTGEGAMFGQGTREDQEVRRLVAANILTKMRDLQLNRGPIGEMATDALLQFGPGGGGFGGIGGGTDDSTLADAANALRQIADESARLRQASEAAGGKLDKPLEPGVKGGNGLRQ